jgi:hypothetical protein
MKCICGYEHQSGFDDGEWKENIIGDERFIKVDGVIFMRDMHTNEEDRVYLYACPKCGTVRME